MTKIAIARRIPPSGPFEEGQQQPCVEQIGFDNVREPINVKAPTAPLPLPFLLRNATPAATPVEVVLPRFRAGNTVVVNWIINGHYASGRNKGQVLFAAPVFQAGQSMNPGRVAVTSPGAYATAADATLINNPFTETSAELNVNVVLQTAFVAVTIEQAALDTLGVTEEAPLVCRMLVVNGGPEDLRVGLAEPVPLGGASIEVKEIGCFEGGSPTKLIFPPLGSPLGNLATPIT